MGTSLFTVLIALLSDHVFRVHRAERGHKVLRRCSLKNNIASCAEGCFDSISGWPETIAAGVTSHCWPLDLINAPLCLCLWAASYQAQICEGSDCINPH